METYNDVDFKTCMRIRLKLRPELQNLVPLAAASSTGGVKAQHIIIGQEFGSLDNRIFHVSVDPQVCCVTSKAGSNVLCQRDSLMQQQDALTDFLSASN